MILDYNPLNGAYILRAKRGEADPHTLMQEHGLDLSAIASSLKEAVLFTNEPFAAVSFAQYATPAAAERLAYIVGQIEASWAKDCGRHFDVPADKELWPFQKASVAYALDREHALIADEPGLGKTMSAITIANEMRAKRVLVVCPAAVRRQWLRRIREWSTMEKGIVYAIESSQRGVHETAEWTVISWDLVRSPPLWRALVKTNYDLLILDEAHYAKTRDAKRTYAMFGGGREPIADPIASRAQKVIALTGTPLPNRPREAYVLARHLCWECIDWMSEEAFNERFNPQQTGRGPRGGVWTREAQGRLPELQNRLRSGFMVRHLKRDVMTQLHMPEYDLIQVEETEAVKQALHAESLLAIDPENLAGADAEILGQITTARRLMGLAMAPQIVQWVKMLLDGGEEKLVLFAWHKEVLDILCKGLAPYGALRVDGSDSASSKDRKIQRFIADPKVKVIVGNTLSMGTGVDGLQTVATHCLLAEPDWTPGNNQQAVDRLDRGGQKGQVQADFFVAPGSIAEKVLASALRKAHTIHTALDRRRVA